LILSSSAEIYRSLRRIKPEKHTVQLKPRDRSLLVFVDPLERPFPKLLLDTTVYIDELQGGLPRSAETALRTSELWHSTVTEAELTALTGLLDPSHSDTPLVVRQVVSSIERRPSHRVLNPDAEVWREAGILAGLLARLQQYGKSERRRALNDALIFLSAAKHGCAVLTRNIADFDLLMQLAPFGKAIFYERRESGTRT
jgi:predicted nucleic acid-binding protein